MKMITDQQVADVLTMREAIDALRSAFIQFGTGSGAVLARGRANSEFEGRTSSISSMGAVLPSADVLGVKVYSTINGQFNFVVNLFSATTGEFLVTMQANALTRLRTAAATAIATEKFVKKEASILAIFGAGVQAKAHIEALLLVHAFTQIVICARSNALAFANEIAKEFKVDTLVADANTAASMADVIVTCTRSTEALFDGNLVRAGCFVAAVGSSKPVSREIDDVLLARAARIVVEWIPAAKMESGEFVQAASGVLQDDKVIELGKALVNKVARNDDDIVIYKSVGIGLEDIAIAKLIADKIV